MVETPVLVRRRLGSDWGDWFVAAFAVFATVFVGWVFLHRSPQHGDLISDLAFVPVNLSAAVLAFRVTRHPRLDRATRHAWARIGAAYLCWWVGDCIWFWFEVVRHIDPSPSIADVFYLSFYVVLAWGLLGLPSGPRTRGDWHKLALDSATVLVGSALLVWYFVAGRLVHAGHTPGLETVLNLAY